MVPFPKFQDINFHKFPEMFQVDIARIYLWHQGTVPSYRLYPRAGLDTMGSASRTPTGRITQPKHLDREALVERDGHLLTQRNPGWEFVHESSKHEKNDVFFLSCVFLFFLSKWTSLGWDRCPFPCWCFRSGGFE